MMAITDSVIQDYPSHYDVDARLALTNEMCITVVVSLPCRSFRATLQSTESFSPTTKPLEFPTEAAPSA
jgi:hypothetical protein